MALRHGETCQTGVTTPALAALVESPRDGDVDVARDRRLVERCQHGDRQAFDELYACYRRRLHRYCIQRLGDPGDAEDVVQEAFTRAWRALPRFAGDRRFYPWLTVIANHLCVDTIRRNSRQTPVEASRLQAGDNGSYETEDAVLQGVDAALVATAFAKLSERHRRVLQLREGSEWSYREIAEHEGVGLTAVEALLWRARQALKREFMLLDGRGGRLAGFAGALGLLRTRILSRLAETVRHPLGAVHHLVRHLASGVDRVFSPSGVLGAFGPVAAATTGVVVLGLGLGLGTMVAAPSSAPAAPVAPVHPTPLGSLPLALNGTGGRSTGAGAPGTGAVAAPAAPGDGSDAAPGGTGTSTPSTSSGNGAVGGVGGVSGSIGSAANGGAGSAVSGAVSGAGSTVGGAVTGATGAVGGAVTGVGSTVGGAVSGVGSTVGGAVTGATGVVGAVGAGVAGAVAGTVDGVTGALGLPPVFPTPAPPGSSSTTVPSTVPGG